MSNWKDRVATNWHGEKVKRSLIDIQVELSGKQVHTPVGNLGERFRAEGNFTSLTGLIIFQATRLTEIPKACK